MLPARRCGACCQASLLACCQPQTEKDEECPRRLREPLKRTRAAREETPYTRGAESQNETPNGSGGKKSEPQAKERADLRGPVRPVELGHQRAKRQRQLGARKVAS